MGLAGLVEWLYNGKDQKMLQKSKSVECEAYAARNAMWL